MAEGPWSGGVAGQVRYGFNKLLKGSQQVLKQAARITACSAGASRGCPADAPGHRLQPARSGRRAIQGGSAGRSRRGGEITGRGSRRSPVSAGAVNPPRAAAKLIELGFQCRRWFAVLLMHSSRQHHGSRCGASPADRWGSWRGRAGSQLAST